MWQKLYGPQSLKYLLADPLQKNCCPLPISTLLDTEYYNREFGQTFRHSNFISITTCYLRQVFWSLVFLICKRKIIPIPPDCCFKNFKWDTLCKALSEVPKKSKLQPNKCSAPTHILHMHMRKCKCPQIETPSHQAFSRYFSVF